MDSSIDVLEEFVDEDKVRADQDSPWKDILEIYFKECIAFFVPTIFADIDWDRGFTFLDKELQALLKKSETGRRIVDKLVKVYRKMGDEIWVLLHLEMQSSRDASFEERMLIYNSRLFDKHRKPVASLAILTDPDPHWRPSEYQRELWGCQLSFAFPMIKLLDYNNQTDTLTKNKNPFAMVVLAQLATLETRHNPQARLFRKTGLTRQLLQSGMSSTEVVNLYRFIDWMLALPNELEVEYRTELSKLEEEFDMPYVSTAERIGIKKGILAGEAKVLLEQMEYKFHSIPEAYRARVEHADEQSICTWAKNILEAPTLEDVFKEH